ncbi:hypothetical protein, partial [Candidatus Binatus sp.]|uniref:hypothetical protein n=1 Tax=Candidatus Binatus sp. TaxID=2811406 RepID=UPI003CB221F2
MKDGRMTVCIAGLCDNRNTLVFAADRRLTAEIEAEPKIQKILAIHPQWRLMYSANNIYPVFDVADYVKEALDPANRYGVMAVNKAVEDAYEK